MRRYLLGDSVCIASSVSGPIDWDILFVNNQNGDTCWYNNQHPDWGVAGNTSGNPSFTGDNLSGQLQDGSRSFISDRIGGTGLPSGTYSVYVAYYDGPLDSGSATPMLSILTDSTFGYVVQTSLLRLRPSSGMKKGDVWFVGTFSYPSMQMDTTGQAIEKSSSGLTKRRT
jgi:hypothetical protein